MSEYINKDGFVTVEPNANPIPGEGNGWLQTGLAFAVGFYQDLSRLETMFYLCRKERPFGNPLIWRSPHKMNPGDETQCDDYWGAALLDRGWAGEVLRYAREHAWDFDIAGKERIDFWFGRFLSFPPFLKLCAGEEIGVVQQTILALSFIWDSFSLGHADGNMRTYCRFSICKDQPGIVGWAARFWERSLLKKYGTHGAAWEAYFGPDHPLSKIL